MSEKLIAMGTAMPKYYQRMASKLCVVLLLIVTHIVFLRGVGAQQKVVIGYDGHAGFQGVVWAAKDLRLFEKHGLTGELVLIPGSARGMAALISKAPISRKAPQPHHCRPI